MAERKSVDIKEATVKFRSGGGSPQTLTFNIGEGNLTYTVRRNIEYRRNRGKLAGGEVRQGDEEPCELSIQGWFNHVVSSSGDPITIMEFLRKEGAGSALESTGSNCEPHAVDVIVEVDTDCTDVEDEILTFSEFRWEEIGPDFREGVLDVSGRSNEEAPSSVRTTIT